MKTVRQFTWKWLLLMAGALIGLSAVTAPASAQEVKTILYDTPVEGQISNAAFEESWNLAALADDRISVIVERTGGTLVPIFSIRDANNQQIQSGYTDESGAQAVGNPDQLPSAGIYTLVVSRRDSADGKTSGSYKLTVKLLGAGKDNPSLNMEPKQIDYGSPAAGELTHARWAETWTFMAPAADVISVNVVRADGTIRPELTLLDGNGNDMSGGYTSRDGASATINAFALPGPGQYGIRVRRDGQQMGGTTGKYAMTLTLEGAGLERPELLAPKGEIKVDRLLTGELTGAQWINVWALDAPAAYRLRIAATRSEGSLIPVVYVFGANNQEIRRGYPGEDRASTTLDMELPGPGKYQVRVAREEEKTGQTQGKYILTVTLLGTGADDPIFNTAASAITPGTPAKGTLTNAKWKDSWTLKATGTGSLTITARRTGGTLIPQVTLLGASQQIIMSAYPDATMAVATIEQYRLPGPGQYTIVVLRERERDGMTTGDYELTVTQGQ